MNDETISALQLRQAADVALARSRFYRRLCITLPPIVTKADFGHWPLVDDTMLAKSTATDLVVIDDDQLVMELNAPPNSFSSLPFPALENEYDMERRYQRIVQVFSRYDVSTDRIVVVADPAFAYFAAELERVMPWPLTIVQRCAENACAAQEVCEELSPATVILASHMGTSIPTSCRTLITFNGLLPRSVPASCRVVDVCTSQVVPWLATSVGGPYVPIADEDTSAPRDFFLQRSPRGTLVVSALHRWDRPPAMPIIRYDTGLAVDLDEAAFRLHVSCDASE